MQGKAVVFKTIDSTNAYAKSIAGTNTDTSLVAADMQTSGRGRLGKDFFSPAGTGIYMSIIVRPDNVQLDSSLLTVAACVAVCGVLEKYTGKASYIKWVNDIFMNGRKVCGILTEAVTRTGGIEFAVVGIGINVRTPSQTFPEQLRGTAGSANLDGVSRNRIISDIYESFCTLTAYGNADHIIEEYRNRSIVIGKTVSFKADGKEFSALAADINQQGNLVVRLTDGRLKTLRSGEISLGSSQFSK